MKPEEFLRLLRRKPFMPIRVHLSDGSAYDIRHPEFAAVSRNGLALGVQEKKGIPEHNVYISWLHITHVKDLVRSATVSAQ